MFEADQQMSDSNYFLDIQEFIAASQKATTIEELEHAFWKTIRRYGFRYYACAHHIDFTDMPPSEVLLTNWPEDWLTYYWLNEFHRIDPVIHEANRAVAPFHWDVNDFNALLHGKGRSLIADARAVGMQRGYTVPLHIQGRVSGSCTVVADGEPPDPACYPAIHLMAIYLHAASLRLTRDRRLPGQGVQPLTRRETQALELVAQGKSDWDIGTILGISQHTVHRHLERTKRKLGVATRTQAVVRALLRGDIHPANLLD